jgi:hypothetical protein
MKRAYVVIVPLYGISSASWGAHPKNPTPTFSADPTYIWYKHAFVYAAGYFNGNGFGVGHNIRRQLAESFYITKLTVLGTQRFGHYARLRGRKQEQKRCGDEQVFFTQ